MNFQLPTAATLSFLICLSVAPASGQTPDADWYADCLALAASDPVAAAAEAEAHSGDGAVHCQAVALFSTGNFLQAENLLDQLAATASDASTRESLMLQAADAAAADERYDDAFRRLRQASADQPDSAAPYIRQAELRLETGEAQKGLAALAFARARDDSPELLVLEASLHRLDDNAGAAFDVLFELLEGHHNHPGGLLELGILYIETGDILNADTALRDLIRLHADDPAATVAAELLIRFGDQ